MYNTEFAGKDFTFLITGDINIAPADYDALLTPDAMPWTKVDKDNHTWYQVGKDAFCYAQEAKGIQMSFNAEIKFEKARQIVEAVASKLQQHTGQEIEVLFVTSDN
jgi:hypothetical protein